MSVAGTRGCKVYGEVRVGGVEVGKRKEVKLRSKMVGYLSLREFHRWHNTSKIKKKKTKKTPSVAYRFAFLLIMFLVRFSHCRRNVSIWCIGREGRITIPPS